ncbi:polyhydroxyalkanoate depolymerase [Henriciella aquimarina]|uniref:polyhydroxyalkanoate depolymerase n=1 Tax=Henriciella aquimarina TaxID=545261 RepID=UPI000A00459B|nr:polyhydroxyalkanoate depolymerase [Henriciella aquimarina]
MLYSLVEMNKAAMAPFRLQVKAANTLWSSQANPLRETQFARSMSAASKVFERATRYYGKPDWQITETEIDGKTHTVTPMTAWASPWCQLVHFETEGVEPGRPDLMIVAPLSGHYATLLRGTVEAFLPTHNVYITDWTDARTAPIWFGRFDLDDYIDHIRDMLEFLGAGAHVVAVCQPGPPVLAAISMMAEDGSENLPATMTYMGSPIDARRSPTVPNKLSEERSLDWFRSKMIHTVPPPWPGAFRRVYPGFIQLTSFMHMNWDRHVDAQHRFFEHLVEGDEDSAEKHRSFYDEYLSVLDLTEEFYIQTIERVFQKALLARGEYRYRDERIVKPAAIESVGLMTVEGELDDISGIGQTQAAHDLCTRIPDKLKADYIQPGVGHYGVFNGSRFRREIVPRVTEFQKQVAGKKR